MLRCNLVQSTESTVNSTYTCKFGINNSLKKTLIHYASPYARVNAGKSKSVSCSLFVHMEEVLQTREGGSEHGHEDVFLEGMIYYSFHI